jgi:hypothetical protein
MKLKPIRNDRELTRALKRIDDLWGAKPGTPKGDELDVLMLLVEKYEDENYAIPDDQKAAQRPEYSLRLPHSLASCSIAQRAKRGQAESPSCRARQKKHTGH